MSIKSRILLSVIILQLIGFAVVIFRFGDQASESMLDNGQQQIRATVSSRLKHFDALTNEMERSARALALSGELIHLHRDDLDEAEAEQLFSSLLVKTFRPFPQAIGGGIWFEPYRFRDHQRLMGPYAYRTEQGMIFSWELNTKEYDYPTQSWYELALPPDWPRDVKPESSVYWTPPYFDEAATESLMMTVDALMFDKQQHLLGMATVDWSMADVLLYLNQSAFTENAKAFLFHPKDPRSLLNQELDRRVSDDLLKQLKNPSHPLHFTAAGEVLDFANEENNERVYVGKTQSGLVFGVIVPNQDFAQVIEQQRQKTLTIGVGIAILFVAIMALLLEILFHPFEQILTLLKSTVDSNNDNQQTQIHPIYYQGNNEFTPIISTFNTLVHQVENFTRCLSESNEELKRSQREIAELNSHLEEKVEERTRELNAKKEEAINSLQQLKITQSQLVNMEKYAAMGELVAGLAHEVNTPLGISVTAVSALEEQLADLVRDFRSGKLEKAAFNDFVEFAEEGIQITTDNLRRAADMISRFKQVAVDQASEKPRDFELGDYLNSIVTSLRPNYKYRPITIDVKCDGNIFISSYPGALSQVFTNLIMNSLIHAFDEGQPGNIEIEVSDLGEKLVLIYQDDGKGMEQEVIDHLFEAFFTTRREAGGSGMGTHVIHELTTNVLQGEVEVSSAPGQGTRYILTIPRNLSRPASQQPPVE